MIKIDYSKLGSFMLRDTGLLSDTSTELIEFLSVNEISTVAKFLECIDNDLFRYTTYSDTMNEARGLADILKNKYFDIPLISDIYLDNDIELISFKLPGGNYEMFGIKSKIKEKTTIYTAINRLGFNDKERWRIISEYGERFSGNRLIDIFKDILNEEYFKRENISIEDKVFFNKVLYIVSYWNNRNNQIIRLGLMNEIEKMLEELRILLEKKDLLDKQIYELNSHIEEVRNNVRVFEDEIGKISK